MALSPAQRLSESTNVLPDMIESFEQDINKAEEVLLFKGKTMRQAQEEQMQWHVYYEQRKNEAKNALRWLNKQYSIIQSNIFKLSVENYQYELSDRARDKIVATHPDCIAMDELVMEMELIVDKLTSICEAFKTRGFVMKDKTLLLTNGLHDVVI